jgi:hypothetical protein
MEDFEEPVDLTIKVNCDNLLDGEKEATKDDEIPEDLDF